MNMFMFSARQLIETGKVTRGYIGVKLNSRFGPEMAADAGLPRLMGAKVIEITSKTPAESAKLLPGDIILEFNHIPIEDDGQLVNVVSMTEVGTSVPLLIFRNRQAQSVEVEIHDRAKYPQ